MARDLSERVLNFVNRRLIGALPSDKVPALEAMLDGDADPAVVDSFFAANVPNRERGVADALVEFRGVYLGTGRLAGRRTPGCDCS